MIKNIRHIQIKRLTETPHLYKAILIFENRGGDFLFESIDDIEEIKLRELKKEKKK
tara:strand:+ start:630 stop:797 length:168 start_codon:yes stop_codon:yes gene_type:complete